MTRLFSAFGVMLRLPQVWITLGVIVWAIIAANGWEPFVDIAFYAIRRLAR